MGSELLQFAAALVLFVAILIGSYWFVYAPVSKRENRRRVRENKTLGRRGGDNGEENQ